MTTSNSIVAQILVSPGYSTDLSLCTADLHLFRELIERQWVARIEDTYPHLAQRARKLGISRYHELSEAMDHVRLWPKSQRILGASAVSSLKGRPFFKDLRDIFGEFQIAEGFYEDTHLQGQEEIYWRLVRPNTPEDVGPLHADAWFHDMMNMRGRAFSTTAFTVKIWIPIYCEPGRNGLLIVPDSHTKDWKYSTQVLGGQPKPKFEDHASPVLLDTPPGNMVIFHERTLHGGAVNHGTHTRVSAEITMTFESMASLKSSISDYSWA